MLNVLNFFFSKKNKLVFQHKIKITTSSDEKKNQNATITEDIPDKIQGPKKKRKEKKGK